MRRNPDALAWAVMLAAFGIWCLLIVGVPYGVWWYVNNATVTPETIVLATQGTVLARVPSQPLPIPATSAISSTLRETPSTITTDSNSQGELRIIAPDGQLLATLIVYPGTQLTLAELASPRFSWSPKPHSLNIRLARGEARVRLPDEALMRAVAVNVATPFGDLALADAGLYSVEVAEAEAQVSVTRGMATVTCASGGATISAARRGVLTAEDCSQVASGGRNIARNGDFTNSLEGTWEIVTGTTPGFPVGAVRRLVTEGQLAVELTRTADNWGMTGIRQNPDYNIRDKRAVILRLDLRIDSQDLGACGTLGTECPIMVRVEFQDIDGNSAAWLQGFYARPDELNLNPTGCPSCIETHNSEWSRYPLGQWEPFDSGNLLDTMQAGGFTPATITGLFIYSSGHSYTALVRDVQLLVQD